MDLRAAPASAETLPQRPRRQDRRSRRGSGSSAARTFATAALLGVLLVGAPLTLGGVHRPIVFAILGSSRHLVVGADSATAAILATGLVAMGATADSTQYVQLASLAARTVRLVRQDDENAGHLRFQVRQYSGRCPGQSLEAGWSVHRGAAPGRATG